MPKICNYYTTFRCNCTCEFCDVWQNPAYLNFEEKLPDYELLKKWQVQKINLTGGEPLLREDLPEILAQLKAGGFQVSLFTNGLLYAEKAAGLKGLLERLHISLDYPSAEEHDRSRGTECFDLALQAIKMASALGERVVIDFTMTRDNVRFLPEMVELSEQLGVPLWPEPVYDFSGTQGFEKETINYIKYFFRKKNVLLNLAMVEFAAAGGNRVLMPRCRAKETTLTILPDGTAVSPCLFNREGKQGKENTCSSCMRWPYMIPSLQVGLDKYTFLSVYSDFINNRKEAKR